MNWAQIGTAAGVIAACSFGLRWLTITIVVLWSLLADDPDKRKYALALLRALGASDRMPTPRLPRPKLSPGSSADARERSRRPAIPDRPLGTNNNPPRDAPDFRDVAPN